MSRRFRRGIRNLMLTRRSSSKVTKLFLLIQLAGTVNCPAVFPSSDSIDKVSADHILVNRELREAAECELLEGYLTAKKLIQNKLQSSTCERVRDGLYVVLGTMAANNFDKETALNSFKTCMDKTKDPLIEVQCLWGLSEKSSLDGEVLLMESYRRQAYEVFKRSITEADRLSQIFRVHRLSRAALIADEIFHDSDLARALIEEAYDAQKLMNNPSITIDFLLTRSRINMNRNQSLDSALRDLRQAKSLSESEQYAAYEIPVLSSLVRAADASGDCKASLDFEVELLSKLGPRGRKLEELKIIDALIRLNRTKEARLRIEKQFSTPDTSVNHWYGDALSLLQGQLFRRLGDLDTAEYIFRSVLNKNSPLILAQTNQGVSINQSLALVLMEKGNTYEANEILANAASFMVSSDWRDSELLCAILDNLGAVKIKLGQPQLAEDCLLRSLYSREALGPNHPKVAETLLRLSELYQKLGDEESARVCLLRSKNIRKRLKFEPCLYDRIWR